MFNYTNISFIKNIKLIIRFKHGMTSKWMQPKGIEKDIQIYNCVARCKVPLITRNKSFVTWYTCGPTVYDSAHIGHASCYVKVDIIQRILNNYFKINVLSVMNITDVDDKIIKRSIESNTEFVELARKYEIEFWEDIHSLGVKKPHIIARVTEYMPEIKQFIQKLINDKKAYATKDGSVYFDLSKYDNYSKLENISHDHTNTQSTEKKASGDFALWKGAKPGEPYWDSHWGKGRPGWHIECSAIASTIFGNVIDFHAGGIDLRFPHHENEEAQSCSFHNINQWVNYWIHVGHLHFKDSVKMSKSLGNTISIKDMLNKYSSDEFRMVCLLSHYRDHMEFTDELMTNSKALLKKVHSFLGLCDAFVDRKMNFDYKQWNILEEKLLESELNLETALRDDFNTAKSINILLELISHSNKIVNQENTNENNNDLNFSKMLCTLLSVKEFVISTLNMFGLSLVQKNEETVNFEMLSDILDIVTDFRQNIRTAAAEKKDKKLFNLCDKLRSDMNLYGIEIKDYKDSSSWTNVKNK